MFVIRLGWVKDVTLLVFSCFVYTLVPLIDGRTKIRVDDSA